MGRRKANDAAIIGEGKVTFDNIYADFRRRHPNLKKEVIHWKPYNYLKIKVYLFDGMILIYDYWNHIATVCKENWKRDHFRPSDPNH